VLPERKALTDFGFSRSRCGGSTSCRRFLPKIIEMIPESVASSIWLTGDRLDCSVDDADVAAVGDSDADEGVSKLVWAVMPLLLPCVGLIDVVIDVVAMSESSQFQVTLPTLRPATAVVATEDIRDAPERCKRA
jgi:hypothetical protein